MISQLLLTINSDQLRARATTLRSGVKCTVHLHAADIAYFNADILAGCNYHASVNFEDGINWLARFRLPNHNAPPPQEKNFDRRSEFATYVALANAGVPVPKVFDVADDHNPLNLIGAGYILMERISGKPLAQHEADPVQKKYFSQQLADIYLKVKQLPFNQIGRLQLPPNGRPEVGPAFFDYSSTEPVPVGPFTQSDLYYKARIQQQISLIRSRELGTSAPVDLYLAYMTILNNLPPNDSGPFFLRHIDSRDANFLIDENYNITGIIDWELAIVTSKESAFQSPMLIYDLGELYNGLSTPSEDEARFAKIIREEKGEEDLARMVAQKLHFRVDLLLETDPSNDDFRGLFGGWWKLANCVETFDWDSWRKEALELYGDGDFGESFNMQRFFMEEFLVNSLHSYKVV